MPRIETSPETHKYVGSPRCPLCSQAAGVYLRKDLPDVFEGWCAACGNVRITQSAAERARRAERIHIISAWLRRQPTPQPDAIITDSDVDRILKDTPDLTILEKLDLTLVQIAGGTSEPGQRSSFRCDTDFPLVYAKSRDEAAFYVRELAEVGFVKQEAAIAQMTASGYQHLSQIQNTARISHFAFVAMWFDPSLQQIYDMAIQPAIREAGYKSIRIDREQHANRIDDEIIGRIKGSRFMVADFTGQRQGVYFEAGFMLGLGRTVIWMCRKGELAEVHFDARQYNYIDYENAAEAKKRLYDRIVAIEGEGPEARVSAAANP